MSLVETIHKETQDIYISDNRSPAVLMLSIIAELGELAEEVDIKYGSSYKKSTDLSENP